LDRNIFYNAATMKIINVAGCLIAVGLFVCSSIPAAAVTSRVGSPQDLGFGVALGQPMGLTAKYWVTPSAAVDGFMGYHFNSNFDAHADYLWHSFSSLNVSSGRLPFYLGLGGRVLGGNDSQFGFRFPLGVSYLFPTEPLEAYAEVAPIVEVAPSIGADVDGMVGLRLYINYIK
jgi:hypothetical protein